MMAVRFADCTRRQCLKREASELAPLRQPTLLFPFQALATRRHRRGFTSKAESKAESTAMATATAESTAESTATVAARGLDATETAGVRNTLSWVQAGIWQVSVKLL